MINKHAGEVRIRTRLYKFLESRVSERWLWRARNGYTRCVRFLQSVMYPYGRVIKTPINLIRYRGKAERLLEIGPGPKRLRGFETLNVVWGLNVDYVARAERKLPFGSETFDLIYASHVLEHIPWYMVHDAVKEWVRILRTEGAIEIWVPDGLKIAESLVAYEKYGTDNSALDGWYKLNKSKDPLIWASARIYSYGDGSGRVDHPNWHRTLFTPKLLEQVLMNAGVTSIRRLDRKEVRGHDHGWINLGMTGVKQ